MESINVNGLVIWGILILAMTLISFGIWYLFLNLWSGFTNRKKLMAWGLASMVALTAAFTFAPLVVVKAQKIRDVSERISDILKNQRDANGLKTIVSDDDIDFIAKVIAQSFRGHPVGRILLRPPHFAQFFFLILALIASCAFIIAMIVKSREEPKKFQEKYKRKSLFEYSDDIFKDINQKSQR